MFPYTIYNIDYLKQRRNYTQSSLEISTNYTIPYPNYIKEKPHIIVENVSIYTIPLPNYIKKCITVNNKSNFSSLKRYSAN